MTDQNEDRLELERKKLKLEIRKLKRSWLMPVATLMVAIASVTVGWKTGFFDLKLRQLELRREQIDYENNKLNDRKHELTKLNEEKQRELDSIIDRIRAYGSPMIYNQSRLRSKIYISGFNFGSTKGHIYLYLTHTKRKKQDQIFSSNKHSSYINIITSETIPFHITSWSDSLISVNILNKRYCDSLINMDESSYNIELMVVDHMSRVSGRVKVDTN